MIINKIKYFSILFKDYKARINIMCYKCHGTPENTQKELTTLLKSKDFKFNIWNTTSVNHLLISMSNHDGLECRNLAIQIYKKYLEWYEENKKDNYFSECGIEQMYSLSCLKNILIITENNLEEKEETLSKLFSNEIEKCRKSVKQISFMDNLEKKRRWNMLKYYGLFMGFVGGFFFFREII